MPRRAFGPAFLIGALFTFVLTLALLPTPGTAAVAAATPMMPLPVLTPAPSPTRTVRVSTATPVYGGEVPVSGPTYGFPRIDPKEWVVEAVTGVVQEVSDPLAGAVKGALYTLLFTGGELTYNHPTVKELWAVSRQMANLLLATLALWSLADLALGQARGRTYHEAIEFLGRVFLGLVFANFSAQGLAWLIRVVDLVTAAFARADLLTRLGPPTLAEKTMLAAIVWLIFWIVATLFYCQVLLRIALIDICLILAPVALVCWTQPRLQRVVRVWWSLLAGLLAGQIVQVVALRLALGLAAAPALGANPILNGMVLIALLFAGMKAPALIGGPRGGEASGVITALSFMTIRASAYRVAAGAGSLVGAVGVRGGGGAASGGGHLGGGLGTPSASLPQHGTGAYGGANSYASDPLPSAAPARWREPMGYAPGAYSPPATIGTSYGAAPRDGRGVDPHFPAPARSTAFVAHTPADRPLPADDGGTA